MTTFVLKQTVDFYCNQDTPVYMCFLDAKMSNGIMQRGQLSPLLYNVYTDDLNHHLQAIGVWCYIGGAWVNSLSYADDIVLLSPTVTALQTLLEVCRPYAGPHDIVYNTTKMNV